MKHTKEQLMAMSDDEVFDTLGDLTDSYIRRSALHEDIMPLAFEYRIWMQSTSGRDGVFWVAGGNTYSSFQHRNPLRAIACCLILVLEGEIG